MQMIPSPNRSSSTPPHSNPFDYRFPGEFAFYHSLSFPPYHSGPQAPYPPRFYPWSPQTSQPDSPQDAPSPHRSPTAHVVNAHGISFTGAQLGTISGSMSVTDRSAVDTREQAREQASHSCWILQGQIPSLVRQHLHKTS